MLKPNKQLYQGDIFRFNSTILEFNSELTTNLGCVGELIQIKVD